MSTGEGMDWMVFRWEQQDGGLALRGSSLPAGEWESWERQLFTLVEVQRDAGAASRPSLCRLMIGGEPVALHRCPTPDPDPRQRIRTYAYKGMPSLLGAREVLGVVDAWHAKVPEETEGPPLDPSLLLRLTPEIQQALTERVRGAESGVTPTALSPLAAGLPRLTAEVLRDPDAMFSCQIAPGADAKDIMWGLMDLLDRVVGTTAPGFWEFSTEQSEDLTAGLPRFVFLHEWPYSSKQSRHTRLDLTKDTHFAGDPYDEAARRLVEAYLRHPAEVAELCRAAGLKEHDQDRRQIARLLKYFGRHPYGLSGTRPQPDVPVETSWPEGHGDLLAPREEEVRAPDLLGAAPSTPPDPSFAPPPSFARNPYPSPGGDRAPEAGGGHFPDADPSTGSMDVTRDFNAFRRGRAPSSTPPRPFAEQDGGRNLLESPEPATPSPQERRDVVREPLGADQAFMMTALVHSLRIAKTGEEFRDYLAQVPRSAEADPENRAVLRAALDEYGCFHDLFRHHLPEDDVDNALEQVTRCGYYAEDMAEDDVFERSARLAGRPGTPSVVVHQLMALALYHVPQERARQWMDFAVDEGNRPPKRFRPQSVAPPAETETPPETSSATAPGRRRGGRPVKPRQVRVPRQWRLSLEMVVLAVLLFLVALAVALVAYWLVNALQQGAVEQPLSLRTSYMLYVNPVEVTGDMTRSAV
ncbi:hypothetical protein ABGB17_29645 [Sphaerisporangium sp. B11E5]|uniref:hypothetical protein n=1 Tax=Sphaerisporangium sp. B11E5 TaxID=3153563 RepID=UPI00325CAE41